MKKICLLAILLQAIAFMPAIAQSYEISGRIVEDGSGEAVSYASVKIRPHYRSTSTGDDGEFKFIGVTAGTYELEVSFVGYESEYLTVKLHGDTPDITVKLRQSHTILKELVVTGTRTERLLSDTPVATQVITGRAIEKMQLSTFRDLLEYELPGVEFTNNGGHANINLLGFGGKYVLFLIDGERMAGETFDNIDYNRIDMDNIERVEIVKGASSSLYGSNAVGGVINIITRKPVQPLQIQTGLRYGSYDELNANLMLSSLRKWGSVSLAGSYKSMSPYLLKDREPIKQLYPDGTVEEGSMGQVYIAGYTDYSVSPRIIVNVNGKLSLDFKGGYYFKERNPGGRDGEKIRDHYHDYTAGLKLNWVIAANQNLSLSGHFDRYDKYDFYKLLNEHEKNYENGQLRASGLYDISINGKHSVVAGIEYFSDDLMTFMFETEEGSEHKKANTIAGFTQQEWLLFKPLTLVTGLRYDYHSEFKGHFTPRIGFMYRPWNELTFRGGYAGGFRAPTLKELYTNWFHPYGGGFQIRGNENMKEEVSHNLNLSAEIKAGQTYITVMAQRSYIKNKISALWIAADTIQYRNIGNARILSAELTASHKFTRNISVKAAYAFVHDNLGKRSTVRPHTATLNASYTASFINRRYSPILSVSGKYFSGMYIWSSVSSDENDDSGIDTGEINSSKVRYDSYMIWRLSVDIPLPHNFTIYGGVNNIFNYKPNFSSFYSSISPGTTFYIGLRWKLKR